MTSHLTRVTPEVTAPPSLLSRPSAPSTSMHACEFCSERLDVREPENVALLYHLGVSEYCKEQFTFAVENLNRSWTAATSGAA